MPGIGTLRQYHNRQSNITTVKDILGEVTDKTPFVEAAALAPAPTTVIDEQRFDNESPATKTEKVFQEPKAEGFEPKRNPADSKPAFKKGGPVTINKNV
jgi:hypothetical protein